MNTISHLRRWRAEHNLGEISLLISPKHRCSDAVPGENNQCQIGLGWEGVESIIEFVPVASRNLSHLRS